MDKVLFLVFIVKVLYTNAESFDVYGQFITIHSKNYPNDYPNLDFRKWTVQKDERHVCLFSLEFSHFNVELSENCTKDYLDINGFRYCGGDLPSSMIVNTAPTEDFVITFSSDASITKSGFQLLIEQNLFSCSPGKKVTTPKVLTKTTIQPTSRGPPIPTIAILGGYNHCKLQPYHAFGCMYYVTKEHSECLFNISMHMNPTTYKTYIVKIDPLYPDDKPRNSFIRFKASETFVNMTFFNRPKFFTFHYAKDSFVLIDNNSPIHAIFLRVCPINP